MKPAGMNADSGGARRGSSSEVLPARLPGNADIADQAWTFRQLSEASEAPDMHDDATSAPGADLLGLADGALLVAGESTSVHDAIKPDAQVSSKDTPVPGAVELHSASEDLECKRKEAAGESEIDDEAPDDASAIDTSVTLETGWAGHYVHAEAHAMTDAAAAEARTVRVERHAAVTELVQILEASAATLLVPEEGMRHDRVDMMLSLPELEGTTVALFVEDGRLIVEFSCASGTASQWLGNQARGMSDALSAKPRRPVLTRVQDAGGNDASVEDAVSALPGDGEPAQGVGPHRSRLR